MFKLSHRSFIASVIALFAGAHIGFSATNDTSSEPPWVSLSLDQCISIALNENPTVKIADMEVKRVNYSKKETLGSLLPSVSFGTTYNRMLEKQVAYMNMSRFPSFGGGTGDDNGEETTQTKKSSGDTGIKMGLDNSWSTGFTASVPLIAPQLWQALKISDSQILRSLEEAQSSRLDMVNSVKSAYYALLLAEDSYKVIQESYDMAAFTYDTYVKNQAVGAASKYDVLRASVAMKNIEPELIQAEIAIKQARLQLLILMGLDASFEFKTDASLEQLEASMSPRLTPRTQDEIANNPSLRINAIDLELAKKNVKLQKMSFLPTLSATFNYNWTSSSDGNPFRNFRWNPYSVFGLNLSFPLFEGGSRNSRYKQAKIQHIEATLQRENLERSITNQVNLAVDNINLNVKQIESCKESEGQAAEAHKIMKESFEIGAASYLDLRDSELALTRARLARLQAVYNYLVADSHLELLLGSAPVEYYKNLYPSK